MPCAIGTFLQEASEFRHHSHQTSLEKHFLNFIADTMDLFPNLMLGYIGQTCCCIGRFFPLMSYLVEMQDYSLVAQYSERYYICGSAGVTRGGRNHCRNICCIGAYGQSDSVDKYLYPVVYHIVGADLISADVPLLSLTSKTFSKFYHRHYNRQVTIFQETARNHFREAGMLMQSYVVETVDQPLLNNTCLVCSRGNGFYANYRGQRSASVFSLFQQYLTVNWLLCSSFLMNNWQTTYNNGSGL